MAETWTISVGGRVYGPYSLEQMQGFHAENRLADHSLVARAGEEQFHPAAEDEALAPLFQPSGGALSEPLHGEQAGIEISAATEHPIEHTATPHRFGRQDADLQTGAPSHFVIVADMKSRSITGLEEEIFNLGPAHRFMPQAWVLHSSASINTIRNALVQKLGKIDTLFIVDAAHDKAAWFNFGPESDTRIRRMWSRPTEHAGAERRTYKRA
jgi:hypothetical protein